MEIKGKIIAVMEKRSGVSQSGKAWSTQEYVIETINEQYPKRCVFNVFGEENIQKFALEVGKVVTSTSTLMPVSTTADGTTTSEHGELILRKKQRQQLSSLHQLTSLRQQWRKRHKKLKTSHSNEYEDGNRH